MYAIVDIAGKQYKVEKGQELYASKLQADAGQDVNFDKVLLVDDNGKVQLGNPTVKGFKVKAKVVEHVKGDKVVVFKKKRRKGYKKRNGHRQDFTKIVVDSISK